MSLLVSPEHVTDATRRRHAMCGRPIQFLRTSGEVTAGRFSCGSSWCRACARVKTFRVQDCIRTAVRSTSKSGRSSESGLVMVTLTLPRSSLADGSMSVAELRERLERKRQLWRDVGTRLRWLRHYEARSEPQLGAQTVPPTGDPDPHPYFSSTWSYDHWEPTCAFACVWALEVTAGSVHRTKNHRRRGRIVPDGHWHVHLHVLVPSREWAERLNSAWQRALKLSGELGVLRWGKTHFLEYNCGTVERFITYIAGYAGKGKDLDKLPAHCHGAYIRATHNVRRYDAQGDWRPLGIGDRPESDDPATHVLPFAQDVHDQDPTGELNVPVQAWYSGKHPAFVVADTREAVASAILATYQYAKMMALEPSALPPPNPPLP